MWGSSFASDDDTEEIISSTSDTGTVFKIKLNATKQAHDTEIYTSIGEVISTHLSNASNPVLATLSRLGNYQQTHYIVSDQLSSAPNVITSFDSDSLLTAWGKSNPSA